MTTPRTRRNAMQRAEDALNKLLAKQDAEVDKRFAALQDAQAKLYKTRRVLAALGEEETLEESPKVVYSPRPLEGSGDDLSQPPNNTADTTEGGTPPESGSTIPLEEGGAQTHRPHRQRIGEKGNNIVDSVAEEEHTWPDPVWYTRETMRLAFPYGTPKERRFVAVLLTAYSDDCSLMHGVSVTSVGTFVSDVDSWNAFTPEWQAALQHFHLTEFKASDFETYQGEFVGWSNERHKEALNCFLSILARYPLHAIGYAVPHQLFDTALGPVSKRICVNPYGLAAIYGFARVGEIAQHPRLDALVECVMDAGTRGFAVIDQIWTANQRNQRWREGNRIIGISRKPSHLFPPLQAADLLAYEIAKEGQRVLGTGRPMRYPLRQMIGKVVINTGVTSEADLRAFDAWVTSVYPAEDES